MTAHDGAADGWADVFPELSGGKTSDPARLEALLAWVDQVPSDLPVPRPSSPAPPVPDRSTGSGTGGLHLDGTCSDDGVFGGFVADVVAPDLARFAAGVRRTRLVADPERVVEQARRVVHRAAADQLTRVLVRRLAEASAAGLLAGATPEARYDDFVDHLRSPAGTADLDRHHPDLLPRVRALTALRLDALADQLARTAAAWPGICADLDLDPADRVRDLVPSGDTHGGGRCVVVLETVAGRRVVMKPRATDLEEGYGAFSAWLGRTALGLAMPRPRFHRTADAGWMEHVGHAGAGAHPDFFRMVGVHLAALHLLRGTDVHYENLLADAEGRPVVVDAEALFTPTLRGAAAEPDVLLDVTTTGLLSLPFGGSGFDFGALDYRSGGASPFRAWHLLHPGRDDMRLEMGPVVVDHPDVVPTGDDRGATRSPADAEDLVEAFVRVMHLVLTDRDAVLDRIAADLRGGRCRYIHRPTMTYALLLRMATHPRFAADADVRRVLGRLAVLAPATADDLVAAEIRQLTAAEIPAFGVDLHDDRLLDARGRDTGVRVVVTPAEGVRAAVAALDAGHVDRQTRNLRAALAHWTGGSTTPPESSPVAA